MLWLTADPSFHRLLICELWISLIYATYNGALIVYLTEIMPSRIRTASTALAYSLAVALFGGFTPAICTWLIHATSNRAAPGAWLSIAALVSMAALKVVHPQMRSLPYLAETMGGQLPRVQDITEE
jgi:hypothetical protein